MHRFSQSLLSMALASGLCGGVAFVQAGAFSNEPQNVRRLADEHWKHPHMHHALEKLRDARHELGQAEDIFKGHKDEALVHVDHAIKEVEEGLKEQHDEISNPMELPAAGTLAEKFPHMHHALDRLREARDELVLGDKIFAGHRDKAIEATDHAIKQLEEGVKAAEK